MDCVDHSIDSALFLSRVRLAMAQMIEVIEVSTDTIKTLTYEHFIEKHMNNRGYGPHSFVSVLSGQAH